MSYRKATIRPFRNGDGSVLFTQALGVFGVKSTWDDRRTLVALETDTVFVAELEGGPAGFVALEQAADTIRIAHLFVNPVHEGEGVGRQLLEYAEGYAISTGAIRLQVVVEDDNRRALDFYRGRGFVARGAELLELALPQA